MSKHPGRVDVLTEVGYCNFCGRSRNLRVEAHRLGSLVRTIVTCESCHRTLTTTVGVASEEPKAEEAAAVEEKVPAAASKPATRTARKPAAKATAKKPAAKASTRSATKSATKGAGATKPKAASKPAAKPTSRPAARPKSTGTRRTAR